MGGPESVRLPGTLCKQFFGLGDNEEPAVLIPIGYAADEPKEKKRKEIGEICK